MTAQTEYLQCPLVETESNTSLFVVCRYDSTTGTFTVPSGGDGLYYFSDYVLVDDGEFGYFDMRINGEMICAAFAQNTDTTTDQTTTSCSAIAYAVGGKTLNYHVFSNMFLFSDILKVYFFIFVHKKERFNERSQSSLVQIIKIFY